MNVESQSPASDSHRCPVCTVIGLPILPLRYALAWAGEGVESGQHAPELAGQFDAAAYPEPETDQAHFTLRLLREGHLYVFDEANDEWSAYEVDSSGSLHRFDPEEGPLEGGPPVHPAMCSRTAPLSLARCIQISDVDKVEKIWMAFSETRWTAEVKARHANAEYRARHMRCIDVGAWVSSRGNGSQPHVDSLSNVFEHVSEYLVGTSDPGHFNHAQARGESSTIGIRHGAPVRVRPHPAFLSSPYGFGPQSRSDFTGLLWGADPEETPANTVPPLMVALDDPVGVTAEVAALMNFRLDEFLWEPGRVRPLAASAAILQLRDAVEHQAELAAAETAERTIQGISAYAEMRGGPGAGAMATEGLNMTPEELRAVRRTAWARGGYESRYDEQARLRWQQQHDEELQELDRSVITPLANLHLELLQSTRLQVHLQCNYDPEDVESGAGYLGAVLSCIADTQDKAPQAELYEKWFNGSPREQDNLLLRAYALNQDNIAEAIASAAEESAGVKFNQLPWDRLFALYGEADRVTGGGALNVWMATLIKETTGPAAKALSRAVDSPAALYGVVAWGAAGKIPLERVVLKGKNSGQIVTEVMRMFEEQSGRRLRRTAARAELRRLGVLGLDSRQRRDDIGFIGIRADGELVTGARYHAERSRFLNAKLVNWRRVINTDLRVGVAGSLLSAVALGTLYEQATGSLQHDREESWARFWSASAGLLGGALELGGKQAERLGNARPRFARFSVVGNVVGFIGRALTAVAGVFIAGIDLYRAKREFNRQNYAMGWLHLGSAFAGGGFALALLFSSVAWGGIFLLLVIITTVAMMVWSDNKRHGWLDRCFWGRLEAERYASAEIEKKEYELAAGIY